MSEISHARRAEVLLKINGVNVSEDINDYLLSFVYVDNYDDKCDDLRIELEDRDSVWLKYKSGSIASSMTENNSNTTLDVGDKVKIKKDAKDYNGGSLVSFMYDITYSVLEIGKTNPDRIVIGIGEAVTAAVNITDLIKYNESGNEIQSITSSETNSLKGASIEACIIHKNKYTDGKDTVLNCGTFQIDSLSYKSPPSKLNISATSLPLSSSAGNQKKTLIWENTKLSGIVKTIASLSGFTYMYESSYDPVYDYKEQRGESDIEFIGRLSKDAGIAVKFMQNMIILYDEAVFENKTASFEINKNDGANYEVLSCNFYDNLNDTAYSSCHVSYTDPLKNVTYEYTYTPRDNPGTGLVLEVSEKVSSREEARQLAMKRLRQKNKGETTASFKLPGDTSLVAGITVNVIGWGYFDGKYIVEKAEHAVYKTSGYTTSLEMHKVLEGY